MNVSESLRTALTNLAVHKLRTTLTMLGMIFGVGAVIAMLSIGAGGERQALETIATLGVDNVIVRARKLQDDEKQEIRKKSLGVSLRDAEAIREGVPGVRAVLPRLEVTTKKVRTAGAKTEGRVFGVAWQQAEAAHVPVERGRFFDLLDERTHAQVCLIGVDVQRELFGYSSPIGQSIKVDDLWLEVIGVLGRAPSGTAGAVAVGDSARDVLMPVTTAMRKLDRDPLDAPLDELTVRLEPGVSPAAAAELIDALLERLHGGADDYEIVVPEALLAQSRRTQRIFSIVMGSIAGISLLVGGIGIMNIMLASVLERTREIGVRRAIGATRRDIRNQFVIEAFAISIGGGLAGIIIGVAISQVVAHYAGWPTVITGTSIALSTGVSIAVGLASGIYPATRAAELDPIESLRYE